MRYPRVRLDAPTSLRLDAEVLEVEPEWCFHAEKVLGSRCPVRGTDGSGLVDE
jgi:hypothetical protein